MYIFKNTMHVDNTIYVDITNLFNEYDMVQDIEHTDGYNHRIMCAYFCWNNEYRL